MSNHKENFIRADPVPTDAEIELAVERLRPNWTRGVPRSRTGGTSHILQSLAHGRSHAVVPGDKTFAPSATVFLRRLPFDPSPLGLNIEFRDLIHGCFEQPGGATLLLQRMPANKNISRHQLVTRLTATTRPL